ncbi:hypothetical protein BDM02DRAFT_3112699 [Thelephora ganbajun]|uniref:Uncharacterized protein n=1 Tax=Thelephora ganbajun TaxID=370292 RepID=A0ACB6ZK93_THEGA|nr:hypothetical protein BDM02DRAFT_3112699 [Thelephora ganbajun]
MTPARAVFGSVSVLLAMIRDSMINKVDYVELGLACADVCRALDRGMNGRQVDQISQLVFEAIEQLTTTVTEIQRNIVERGKRRVISRLFHAKNDKDTIAAWRLDINRVLHVFNTELAISTHVVVSDIRHDTANTRTIVSGVQRDVVNAHTIVSDVHHGVTNTQTVVSDVHQGVVNTHAIVSELQHSVTNTHTIVSDIRRIIVKSQEASDDKNRLAQTSIPGESPPPAPRACFGREELIEKIIVLTESLTPIALIGVGGIGKTSIALTILHNNRIKEWFGVNRRFIRCDKFPASLTHFLRRLSEVIGAGVENPEDLTPLRPFLSSKKILLVLDNAESVLDPQGANAQEIYDVVEELTHFDNICLCITSRISTIPSDCETLEIPTLPMEAARDTFYRIYKHGERSDSVNAILKRLDFHPLSITLLATVAHHNKWSTGQLTREWERRRTGVLQTEHNKSLAATIELSLASPMFQELGPDARELLGAIAFFPQGVDENNLGWLLPNIPNGTTVLDKFCILSLTYRSNNFITMLAPLRDYLCPKDPKSSPLLCTTKERYLTRMSVELDPNRPGFGDAQWITSEDVNVEHLLDVFTSIDANSDNIWDASADFMRHLFWHKKRLIVLKPKIEGLPDDHRSKPECLLELSQLFRSVGNYTENQRLLMHASKLWRERGDGYQVAKTLMFLAYTNRRLLLHKEGILQAKESLEICEQLNHTVGQAHSLRCLAWLLQGDNQFDAAEAAASRAIDVFKVLDEKFEVCQAYRLLGKICHSKGKGKREEAISHFKAALELAATSDWYSQLFWNNYSLAELFLDEEKFDDARVHVERAKSHAVNDPFLLGRGTHLQAIFWYKRRRLEEAKSEALCAVEVFEKLGSALDLKECRDLLRDIQKEMDNPVATHELDGSGCGRE